jgi:hypothetical protein
MPGRKNKLLGNPMRVEYPEIPMHKAQMSNVQKFTKRVMERIVKQ